MSISMSIHVDVKEKTYVCQCKKKSGTETSETLL